MTSAVLAQPGRFRVLRRMAAACLTSLAKKAAGAYVVGDRLTDALAVARTLASGGIRSAVGYFNEDEESPRAVANEYRAAAEALVGGQDYLSIKLPALVFSSRLLAEVAQAAAASGIRLHLDSLWYESVGQTIGMVDELLGTDGAPALGITLPGRFARSVDDARWAGRHKLSVRVVKGQWADPGDQQRDPRRRFIQVVGRLAGGACHVAVATHDHELAEEAIHRLRRSGTSCELELLHGLPMGQSLKMARRLAIPVRVYVPYGKAHLPYAISRVASSPRLAWWLLKDLTISTLER